MYVIHENRHADRKQYLQTLEQRLSELEATLASQSPENVRANEQNLEGEAQSRQSKSASPTTSSRTEAVMAALPSMPSPRPGGVEGEKEQDGLDMDTASINSVTDILRDLSIEASGGYIGASSNITMGRMIGSLVRGKAMQRGFDAQNANPKSLYEPTSPSHSEVGSSLMSSPETCDRLLLGYLKHISLRWPLLRTSFIRSLHANRDMLEDAYHLTILHLVYAIGGRFLETTGQAGAFYPEEHHNVALQHLDSILELHDLRSIEVLLLLAIHSLRAPRGPGAWAYVGLAMRLCVDLGLHRKTNGRQVGSMAESEMRKRVFWTGYCLDRQVSIVLGRPFAISDRDIDAEVSRTCDCHLLPLIFLAST